MFITKHTNYYMIFNTNSLLYILRWTNFALQKSIFDSLFLGIFKGVMMCKEMPNMLTFLKNELLLYHGMSFGSISNPKLERRKDNYSFSQSNFYTSCSWKASKIFHDHLLYIDVARFFIFFIVAKYESTIIKDIKSYF